MARLKPFNLDISFLLGLRIVKLYVGVCYNKLEDNNNWRQFEDKLEDNLLDQ